MNQDPFRYVAVLGAGLMGHGIAQIFAHEGYEVFLYDVDREVLWKVPERVRKNLQVFLDLGLTDDARVEACLSRITLCPTLREAVRPADVVIEAVNENRDLKKSLFFEIEPDLGEEAIVCTNTSAISITDLSDGLRYRERFVGTHFWNPPQVVPCVEVIRGEFTSEVIFEKVYDLMKRVGKEPVRVLRDVPGFLGNRLQHAMWREAISLVEKGIADPEEIDRVVKYGFGLRLAFLGPLETADLAGLDLTRDVQKYLFPYLENSTQTSLELDRRVESGVLGAKTHQGFHSWSQEKIGRVVAQRDRLLLNIIRLLKTFDV